MTTQQAINHFGGIRALAEALNVWPHGIYRWGKYPPKQRQYEIQVKSAGVLKVEGTNDPA